MTMTGMPGAVRPTQNAPAPLRRFGLVRMAVGSIHPIPLPTGAVHCQARDPRDHYGAKTKHFCLHPACAAKTWDTHEEMRRAHPDTSQMTKAQEIHVYGLWSDDKLDPERVAELGAALKKAQKEAADIQKLPVNSLSDREVVKEVVAAAEKAKADLAAADVCIGLIAPPEPRLED